MTTSLERARRLVELHLDGQASEAEIAELDRLVREDEAVARELMMAVKLESALEVSFRSGVAADDAVDETAEVASADVATAAAPRAPALPWFRRPASRRLAVGMAAMAAAAAAVILAWPASRAPSSGDVRSTEIAPSRPADLRFADGSTAELRAPDTIVETRSSGPRGIDVALLRGAARFDVVPRANRHFRVWVGSLQVEVIGTLFTVERLAASVRVSVERGSVKVISTTGETLLTPGSAEVVPLSASPPPPDPPPPDPPASPAASGRSADKRDEARALLGAANSARRAGRLEEAVAHLRRMIDHHPRDPRAAYAAFILGRVLLDELERPREAATAFARVGTLEPETPLLQDALAREVEAWSRAGDAGRAAARGREYLSRYPNGRRRQEVRFYSRLE